METTNYCNSGSLLLLLPLLILKLSGSRSGGGGGVSSSSSSRIARWCGAGLAIDRSRVRLPAG